MAKGFVTGALWGIVAAAAGLVVLSQMAPLTDASVVGATLAPVDRARADQPETATTPTADQAIGDWTQAEPASDKATAVDRDRSTADKAPASTSKPAKEVDSQKTAALNATTVKIIADEAASRTTPAANLPAADVPTGKAGGDTTATDEPVGEKVAEVAVEADRTSTAPPTASTSAPVPTPGALGLPAPDMPASDGSAPSLTNLDQALTVPEEEPAPISAEPAPTTPEGPRDTLLAPGQSVNPSEPARLPQIAPVTDPDIAVLQPDPVPEPAVDLAPAQSPASTLKDSRPTLPPAKPLQNKLPATVQDKVVPGVKTGNLPQIGAAKEAETVPTDAANIPPVQKFARQFDNAAQKPLFVILLHDVGSAGMRREDLATLPFPVSFVVDPLATDAKEASAAYRAAGQEVLTLANGIPPGATANDLETTFQTLSGILPESVAVIDQEYGGFQDRRLLATLVLPVIKGEGRGLVTYDRGLNAADQIARRDDVPSTVIFRRLDAEDENKSTIRRYLDRAAFKAAQDGLVVVIGDTRAETVAAILEWTVEGKASTVTLAPVTAVLGR